jgi:transposase
VNISCRVTDRFYQPILIDIYVRFKAVGTFTLPVKTYLLIDHDAVKELDSVYELIDWDRLEHHLKDIHSSSRGEKAWPPLMMFKALLLQSWYKLSDSALEKQLARDLLFRRFIACKVYMLPSFGAWT